MKKRFQIILVCVCMSVGLLGGPIDKPRGFNSGLDDVTVSKRIENVRIMMLQWKSALPALIEQIDRCEYLPYDLTQPVQSYWKPNTVIHRGVLAAYLIEMIVSRDELDLEVHDEHDVGYLGVSLRNYIFEGGRILKSDNEVNCEDLKEIKKIYMHWWGINKTKTLGELRSEWKKGKQPLSDSIFKWR